jgi:transcription elongation factor SPT5
VYGKSITRKNQVYVFQCDTYRDGFLEKDFKVSGLVLDDIYPTLDEITQFARRDDDASVNLSAVEASCKAAIAVLEPGDHVEVFEGEQASVHGIIEEVSGDVVTMTAQGVDVEGQKMETPTRSVRKKFNLEIMSRLWPANMPMRLVSWCQWRKT